MEQHVSDRFGRHCIRIGRFVSLSILITLAGSCSNPGTGAPDDILTNGTKLYSQFDEELIIRHYFDDRTGGFYLDVGCFHWEESSTTAYLEKHLDWKGFAFDAQPTLAVGWAKHRPKAKFFNYIVTDHSGTVEAFFVAGGLSSVHEDHIKKFPVGEDVKPRKISIPTITLNEVLDREGIKKVDFLSMDIEAGEPAALEGFDINRFQPELVCVEAAKSVREPLMEYFTTHGYERIEEYLEYDQVNWYFRPSKRHAIDGID